MTMPAAVGIHSVWSSCELICRGPAFSTGLVSVKLKWPKNRAITPTTIKTAPSRGRPLMRHSFCWRRKRAGQIWVPAVGRALADAVSWPRGQGGTMMKSGFHLLALAGAAVVALGVAMAVSHAGAADTAWSPEAAARYLDGREAAWQAWDRPHKDRDTLCISCHTQGSYGLARPALHKALNDPSQSL